MKTTRKTSKYLANLKKKCIFASYKECTMFREINIWIDDFTPCLKDNLTGEVANTEVIRIRRKSFLNKFNRKNGWYVNWGKIVEEYDVYALVLEGTVDIQGLVALKRNEDLKAMYGLDVYGATEQSPNDQPFKICGRRWTFVCHSR